MKRGARECFRIESGVREDCVMSPLTPQCIYGCSDERGESGEGEDRCKVSGGCKRVVIDWSLVYRFCMMSWRRTSR